MFILCVLSHFLCQRLCIIARSQSQECKLILKQEGGSVERMKEGRRRVDLILEQCFPQPIHFTDPKIQWPKDPDAVYTLVRRSLRRDIGYK